MLNVYVRNNFHTILRQSTQKATSTIIRKVIVIFQKYVIWGNKCNFSISFYGFADFRKTINFKVFYVRQ